MKIRTFYVTLATVMCAFVASASTRAASLRAKLESTDRNYVFVAMHRGDWRHAPENSIDAIKGAIAMGADIVEIDVARTKDGHYILLHDETLERVSNGTGLSSSYTLTEIKQFRLKGVDGITLTDYQILTLEEAFALTKGKILVNIDKFSRDPKGVAACARKCGVEREVILKGHFTPTELKAAMGDQWSGIIDGTFLYMPIIWLDRPNAEVNFRAWSTCLKAPFAYELCFASETSFEILNYLETMQQNNGPRIWMNTLWDSLCARHSDERGFRGDVDGSWGWCLSHGATMIQTDRPADLLNFLTTCGRRSL
ncbi:MAG: glycerophosphodiester phosphodiesterase family protein [Kiritimatiellae bacterium]|nr:glycerophosphodiester phosphodiesterase family protein [Kiritimatiellia bacterium]